MSGSAASTNGSTSALIAFDHVGRQQVVHDDRAVGLERGDHLIGRCVGLERLQLHAHPPGGTLGSAPWSGKCSRTATGSRKRRRSTSTDRSCSPTCSVAASTDWGPTAPSARSCRSGAASAASRSTPTAASCVRVATSCTCATGTRPARCCTSTASRVGTICAPIAAGNVYAGALRFAVFDPKAEAVPGELWRVAPDGDSMIVFGDVVHANGVACTPDGDTIYLSDTRRRASSCSTSSAALAASSTCRRSGTPTGWRSTRTARCGSRS